MAFGTDGSPVGHICLRTTAGLMVNTLLWRVKCGSSSGLISMVFSGSNSGVDSVDIMATGGGFSRLHLSSSIVFLTRCFC
ncbi:unnamed protein product [Arabidopsis lyrata]|nr:unnamed protein product [Arabidopsis lyrata]